MPKTIHRPEYQALLQALRERREAAGLTQTQCSDALGRSQSFMSDVERGNRRLDVIQLFDLCELLGVDAKELIDQVTVMRKANKRSKRHR